MSERYPSAELGPPEWCSLADDLDDRTERMIRTLYDRRMPERERLDRAYREFLALRDLFLARVGVPSEWYSSYIEKTRPEGAIKWPDPETR